MYLFNEQTGQFFAVRSPMLCRRIFAHAGSDSPRSSNPFPGFLAVKTQIWNFVLDLNLQNCQHRRTAEVLLEHQSSPGTPNNPTTQQPKENI
jgi:hypothetical protein